MPGRTRTFSAAGIALMAILAALSPASAQDLQNRVEQLESQVDALADALERERAVSGGGSRTSVGGYGELHYNNLSRDDGSDFEEIDYHRFVLFFSHEFTDSIRFVSELELEHSLAGEGKPGEVELEQAYVEFDHAGGSSTQAGLFLVPVGILNETHEPTTFYGVERNDVEGVIIPTTWWEAGVQHIRRFGEGWQWNVALHSGVAMPTDGGSAFRVRSGRQKVASARASDFALTNRIKYTGIAGLEIGAAVQVQGDPSQVSDDGLDDGTLLETHVAYNRGPFGLRALYATWDFSGDAVEAAPNEADSQSGWYVEPSYKLSDAFGIYARASTVEAARAQDNFDQIEVGFNWWPHEQVVFKFDYRDREHDLPGLAGSDFDGFDLGFGYWF